MLVRQAARQGANVLLGGSQYIQQDDTTGQSEVRFALSVVNLDTRQSGLIPLGFLPHGVSIDPNATNRVFVCEKKGPGAAAVDLDTMTLLRNIPTSPERAFYGHCAISADGRLLYATENYLATGEGAIVIRDIQSLEVLGEFPSHGGSPHECQIHDQGRTMVVTNGGGPEGGPEPNVAYIDIESERLLKRETLTNPRLNTGHLMIGDDRSLVVVSAPRDGLPIDDLGGVSIQPVGQELVSMTAPAEIVGNMVGEALSVSICGPVALVTHPDGDMITFWSIEDRHCLGRMNLPKPRGVTLTLDRTRFLVTFDLDASILPIDTRSLEAMESQIHRRSFITGSHIYNFADLV